MKIENFCGEFHFAALDFTFCLLDEITVKIQERVLFHEEQIFTYARKQLEHFFLGVRLTPAALYACKNEIWQTLSFKLKCMMTEGRVLRCV